jgi:hypothetical protein
LHFVVDDVGDTTYVRYLVLLDAVPLGTSHVAAVISCEVQGEGCSATVLAWLDRKPIRMTISFGSWMRHVDDLDQSVSISS